MDACRGCELVTHSDTARVLGAAPESARCGPGDRVEIGVSSKVELEVRLSADQTPNVEHLSKSAISSGVGTWNISTHRNN